MIKAIFVLIVILFAYIELSRADYQTPNEDYTAIYDHVADSLADELGIERQWLDDAILAESGARPGEQNKFKNTGLIQIAPATAIELGFTVDDIAKMDSVSQLRGPVAAYLKPFSGKLKTYEDVRVAIFFPAALRKNPDYVLKAANLPAALVAKRNPSFDKNKDGIIQKKEYTTSLKY